MEELSESLHAYVDGHVQGVGFRYFVYESAQRLDVKGWVRNRYDGKVEVWAEGPRSILEVLLDQLRLGPSRSLVSEVKVEWLPPSSKYSQFSILPTD